MSAEPRAERLDLEGGGAVQYTEVEVRLRFRFDGKHTLGAALDMAERKLMAVTGGLVMDGAAYRTTIGGTRL